MQFTFIAFESFLFYLLFRIFFDHYSELEVKDLKKQYYKNHVSFFSIVAIIFFLMFYVTLMIVHNHSLYETMMMAPPILLIFPVVLAITKKRRIHEVITVLIFLMNLINMIMIS